ncbi:MAG: hypothetical protein K0Q48_3603 [Bacillota bacterium]|jgi:hypothetical protein|nr:hypothetical protein [Bacillota bacterium]
MKRSTTFWFQFVLIAIMVLCCTTSGYATSWIKLEPAEVDKRAEIIAYGTYDFSRDVKKSFDYHGYFSPISFQAEKYYRGSGESLILTEIDPFDIENIKEAQQEGTSFLLFLESDQKDKTLLIPIAGPNGIIEIADGKPRTGDADEDAYYRSFLEKTDSVAAKSGFDTRDPLFVFVILLLISSIFAITARLKSKGQ